MTTPSFAPDCARSGVDALLAIKARAPELPVLILSSFPEEHYATTLLRQGCSGHLGKDCDSDEIVKAMRSVVRGRRRERRVPGQDSRTGPVSSATSS